MPRETITLTPGVADNCVCCSVDPHHAKLHVGRCVFCQTTDWHKHERECIMSYLTQVRKRNPDLIIKVSK